MARKFLTHLDLNQNELQNAVIQRLSSNPSTPVEGQIYYNTSTDTIRFYDGAQWIDLPTGGAGGVKITITNSAPTVNNDDTEEYSIGSLWIDNTNGNSQPLFYLATSVATGAAVWVAFNATTYHSTNPSTSDTAYSNGHLWVNTTAQQAWIKAGVDSGNAIWKEVAGVPSLGSDDIANDSDVAGSTVTDALENLDAAIGGKADQAYVDGLVQGISWKNPVRVATTANINLANALENGDTIDGITLVTGDRVLVKNQTTKTQNGIYIVPASGAASRSDDASTAQELKFAVVGVEVGTANADTVWIQTAEITTIGSDNVEFTQFHTADVPNASTIVAGKVELATTGETEAKSDTTRAVTPSGLATFARKYSATIGDNTNTSLSVTHNLGSKDVSVTVYQVSDDTEVECDVVHTSTSAVTLTFAVAPATNSLRAVVIG